MPRTSAATTLAPSAAYPAAPAFAPDDKAMIAEWSAAMRGRGVRAEIVANEGLLTEALHVTASAADESWWLVHRTPSGAVAVRLWPGIAEIVATVAEALAVIAAALDGQAGGAIFRGRTCRAPAGLRRPN
jgi:hypothetical protein